MEYEFEAAFGELAGGAAAGVATGILLLFYFLVMGVSLVSYVLGAVGAYRIAKRRGIHHAWLAWVPVGNCWLLGSISDHYQYIVKQKVTKRRRVLLILNLAMVLLSIALMVAIVATFMVAEPAAATVSSMILPVALLVIGMMAMFGLSVAVTVFAYIAYFDLLRSCKPGNGVLFLVLGVLFSMLLPIFVFAVSGSDEGMPARRAPQKPAEEIPQGAAEEVASTEEEIFAEEEIPVVETQIVEDTE